MANRNVFKSDIFLFTAALIWGFAFVAQKEAMNHIGPFAFMSLRFFLGSLTLLPFMFLRKEKIEKKTKITLWQAGLMAGILLFLGTAFQQIGIKYTTAGNAGFITSLYVIFTLILGVFVGVIPKPRVWVGAFLATIGLYFLSVTDSFEISKGDLLTLGCAIVFAGHVQIISWLSPKFSSLKLALSQFLVAGVLSLVMTVVLEPIVWEAIKQAWVAILYVGIFSTGIAFTLQIIGQKSAPPTHAAIILSFEAVFAAFGGWLLLNEGLSLRSMFGCALMLAGMIIAQINLSSFRKKPQTI
jgi:drug/metabolite transporter (DMT)-like permease